MSIRVLGLLVVATAMSASSALANPVTFTFTSVVGGNGTTVDGTSVGQPFEIVVTADNGSLSPQSGEWGRAHHLSTMITIGDSFTLEQLGPLDFEATTDASGAVTSISLVKSAGRTVDTSGTAGDMAVAINGARNIIIDGENVVDADDLTEAGNWTASVPE